MLERINIKAKLNNESNKISISEKIRYLEILMSQKNINEKSERDILKLYNELNYAFSGDKENINKNNYDRFSKIKELFKKEHKNNNGEKNKKTSTASILSSTSKIKDETKKSPHISIEDVKPRTENLTTNTSNRNEPKSSPKIIESTDDHKTKDHVKLKQDYEELQERLLNTALFQDIHYDILSAKNPSLLNSSRKDIKKSKDFSISTSEKHNLKETEIPFFCKTSYINSKEYYQELEIHLNKIKEQDSKIKNHKSIQQLEEQALEICMTNFKRRQAEYIKSLNIVQSVTFCEQLFKECLTIMKGAPLSQNDEGSSLFYAKEILKLSKTIESQLLNIHFQMGWSLEKIMSETQKEDAPANMTRRVQTILTKATQLRNVWDTNNRENILNYLKDQRIKPIGTPGSNIMFTIPEIKLAALPARFLIPNLEKAQKEEILKLYNLPNKIKQCWRTLHENKEIFVGKNQSLDPFLREQYTIELTTNLSQLMKNYAEIEAKFAAITHLGWNLEPKHQKLLSLLQPELIAHWEAVLPTSEDRQTFNNKLLGIQLPLINENSAATPKRSENSSLKSFR